MRLDLAALTIAMALGGQLPPRPADIPFRTHAIDPGASETAAVADINRDGRLDIVSGDAWYEAPRWTKHTFRELGYSNQYIDTFSDLIVDVDADGWPDVVSVSWFAKRIACWMNPGRAKSERWKSAEIHGGFNVEFAILADMDNDGKANEIVAQENGTGQAWYELQRGAFVRHAVSDRTYGHGIGAGDVNGDGRNDLLTPRGWLEAPADPRAPATWTFHADWETTNVTAAAAGGKPTMTQLGFMHVLDVNGDGRNDVVAGAGHDYGVFWFEHQPAGAWPRRTIDTTWSQAHAATLVDLNGDRQPDLVTGKRFMAHNGNDPGEREPLGVYWYEFRNVGGPSTGLGAGPSTGLGAGPSTGLGAGPSTGLGAGPSTGLGASRVEWIRHVIEYGGRVGGGMQIPVVDIDGDGDRDLVCAGKSGLFLLENQVSRPPKQP